MKREIPLFILDTNRNHKLGECDFLYCSDVDSGFIAKIDFVEQNENYVDDTTRIECNSGIGARMVVKRIVGANPDKGNIRTLMKQAFDFYKKNTQVEIDMNNPSYDDCINFIDALITGNKHNIDSCGADYIERQTVIRSINMLESIKRKLYDNKK